MNVLQGSGVLAPPYVMNISIATQERFHPLEVGGKIVILQRTLSIHLAGILVNVTLAVMC